MMTRREKRKMKDLTSQLTALTLRHQSELEAAKRQAIDDGHRAGVQAGQRRTRAEVLTAAGRLLVENKAADGDAVLKVYWNLERPVGDAQERRG